ncbi:MAG: chromate resistance protein [Thermodesulfovibrionales bacterium]
MIHTKGTEWLLFFYTVPSRPVGYRVKVRRRLAKAGAVALKGSVYALPHSGDNHEFLGWLSSEVASMGGEGLFVRTGRIENLAHDDLIALFNIQRARDYGPLEKALSEVERALQALKKGGRGPEPRKLASAVARCASDFAEIRKVDFFSSEKGRALERRLKAVEEGMAGLKAEKGPRLAAPQGIAPRRPADYAGRTWVTRSRPFVDRMASAWLIRKFIDGDAVFAFTPKDEAAGMPRGAAAFDIKGGEFTHSGDLCTFEVMLRAFRLKDKALRKMAAIVHELDLKDGRYSNPEARGVEEILSGIRKTVRDDREALEKGMAVFEHLFASFR